MYVRVMDDMAALSLRIADLRQLRDDYRQQGKLQTMHVIETLIFDAEQKLAEQCSKAPRQE